MRTRDALTLAAGFPLIARVPLAACNPIIALLPSPRGQGWSLRCMLWPYIIT